MSFGGPWQEGKNTKMVMAMTEEDGVPERQPPPPVLQNKGNLINGGSFNPVDSKATHGNL